MGVWSSGTSLHSPGAPHCISGLCFAIPSFSQLYCCLRKDLSSRMAEATGAGLEEEGQALLDKIVLRAVQGLKKVKEGKNTEQ